MGIDWRGWGFGMGVREVGLVGGDNREVVKGEDTGESSTIVSSISSSVDST